MSHTNNTLELSENWDLKIGADGSLKRVTGKDATLQNVANECRCFRDDLFFERDRGVDWFRAQLGQVPQKQVMRTKLRETAQTVDGVKSVESVEVGQLTKDRSLGGQIIIETTEGENGTVNI